MKFTRKQRLGIFNRVVWVALAPFIGVWLLSVLNVNPRDPKFKGEGYEATYSVKGHLVRFGCPYLELETRGENRLWTMQGATEKEFTVKEDEYSLFWAYWPNPVVLLIFRSSIDNAINSTRVVDYTGLLGEAGREYRMELKERIILWSRTLDSQASYVVAILDDEYKEVATGIYDGTCGLLFRLETHTGSLGVLELEKTNFPISRNRNWEGLITLLWGLGLLAYQLLYRGRKLKPEGRGLFLLETDLVIFGILAIWIDVFYDVWFFHYLWTWGMVAIHLLAAAYIFLRFGWWGIFALLELLWAAILMGGKDDIIPQMTYFPGVLVAWLGCLLFQDFRKRLKPKSG